jgi:hypothetical protein
VIFSFSSFGQACRLENTRYLRVTHAPTHALTHVYFPTHNRASTSGLLWPRPVDKHPHIVIHSPVLRYRDCDAIDCDRPLMMMMIVLLLFLQKQSLAFAVYLFGIGTLHTGPGLKKKKAHVIMLSP